MVTWKDAGVVGAMIAFIGIFVAFSYADDGVRNTFAVIFMIFFGLALIWFTPIGNPIKDFITKLRNKKQ